MNDSHLTRNQAGRLISTYCVDEPRPDAIERLASIDLSTLSRWRSKTSDLCIHSGEIVEHAEDHDLRFISQDDLDRILYGKEPRSRTMNAETFAIENLVAYEGDIDAANHGGTFFSLNRKHREWGYIEALRIYRPCDAPLSSLILIESLTLLPYEFGTKEWQNCADCADLSREEYEASDERTKLWMDASACLAYGRYDPAEMGYQHHTFSVLTETLDDDAMSVIDTASLIPRDVACVKIDEDGDEIFDESAFWDLVKERADATFSDLTSEDNLSAEEVRR